MNASSLKFYFILIFHDKSLISNRTLVNFVVHQKSVAKRLRLISTHFCGDACQNIRRVSKTNARLSLLAPRWCLPGRDKIKPCDKASKSPQQPQRNRFMKPSFYACVHRLSVVVCSVILVVYTCAHSVNYYLHLPNQWIFIFFK